MILQLACTPTKLRSVSTGYLNMSSKTKIIVVVLGVAVLLGVIYLMFFNNSSDTSAVSETGGAATSPAQVNFLNLLSQIQPVTFDTTILSDPRFTSLVDIHTAILPEAVGRKDPFAPLPGQSSGT
jgi:hypothetical protein